MNLVKPLKTMALATAISTTALIGGGALIRNNANTKQEPTKLEQISQGMQELKQQSYNEASIENKKKLDTCEEMLKDFHEKLSEEQKQADRDYRDNKINNEKNQDLQNATNDLERAAIKAYALTRIGTNHIEDKLDDAFSK